MSYSIVVGDLQQDLNLDLNVDLTTAVSYQLLWRKPDDTETLVALTAADLTLGQVKRVWVAGDTDMAGVHRGRVVVTWEGDIPDPSDDRPQTFPNDGTWFIWYVYE